MVRAPCCEKMGLKKGPWTPEEDQVLVSYIQQNGHGNWRALPKQAGLLRCGKSCRLRWTNYLRPDIKRGNFSKEEEDTIIQLHETLGNRWSAIAARLPGRTDNEIKNVWHTHLKKKVKNHHQTFQDTKRHSSHHPKTPIKKNLDYNDDDPSTKSNLTAEQDIENVIVTSPQHSSSEVLSSVTDTSATDVKNNLVIKQEMMDTPPSDEYFPQIDESFWSEEISVDNAKRQSEIHYGLADDEVQFQFPLSPMAAAASGEDQFNAYTSKFDDGMDFWYDVFIRAADLPDLPEF
ncbi:hypothetical protein ACH5RR_031517 [Cinchona calisaya]|uniref:Uncharacterized protein n=1 Tax=Cinchona calisaya TaxID=153742 RepID=A0ABD2YFG6_9GENT